MVDLNADRERVLKKVQEEPGLKVGMIEWELAKEGFGLSFEGKATVTLTLEMLQKYKKVGSRLSELKAAGKVKRSSNNRKYYPDVGAGLPAPQRTNAKQSVKPRPASAKVRQAALAEAHECIQGVDTSGF